MRAAMVHEDLLEERHRMGHDRFDEVWEGVLHMVPFPTPRHQRLETDLLVVFNTIARRRGLLAFGRTGLYDPHVKDDSDYRGPDLMIVDRRYISERGVEGNAHVVVEILSPKDEAKKKLPFFTRIGVREAWYIDQRCLTVEVFAGMTLIEPVAGIIHAPSLGLELRVEGSTLSLRDGADTHEVDIRDAV